MTNLSNLLAQTKKPSQESRSAVEVADIQAGQTAPFSGKILTRRALARIITKYEQKIKGLEARVSHSSKSCAARLSSQAESHKIKLSAAQKKAEAQRKICTTQTVLYRDAVKRRSAWYRSPSFMYSMGVLSGGLVCVGAFGVAFVIRK